MQKKGTIGDFLGFLRTPLFRAFNINVDSAIGRETIKGI